MVVGGYGGSTTTEVYQDQDNEWRTVSGKLPRALIGMVATTINDKIILFGTCHLFMSVMSCSLFFKL